MSNQKLPCPRFELRWKEVEPVKGDMGGRGWECEYALVIPLGQYDIRHTDAEGNPTELRAELGKTRRYGGGEPVHDGVVDVPYRDGAHARWDKAALGTKAPIVAVYGEHFSIVDDEPVKVSADDNVSIEQREL